MKIFVDLPQPVELEQNEKIELYLPDASGVLITVHGTGTVSFQGNGGGAAQFSLNLEAIAASIRADLH